LFPDVDLGGGGGVTAWQVANEANQLNAEYIIATLVILSLFIIIRSIIIIIIQRD